VQQDPVVSQVKLIAEPWDVGEGGYQVGNFPGLWTEWNGKYRDTVRDYWRGEPATLGEFASEKFCVWKTCETRADCGGGKDYCCNQIAGTGDNPLFKQCAFSTDGKCL
jgi:hypothetical protein